MTILAGILLGLGVVTFVLAPLAAHRKAPMTDGPDLIAELRELYALKEVAFEALRDLELDFHAGKIGEPDFRELTERTKGEAVLLVQRIDALEARIPTRPGGVRGGG
jgi:hypothetical protein